MSNATDQGRNYAREHELIDAHGLDAAIRMFLNRWAPDAEECRAPRDFEADFIQIVQRIYREAQAPYVKAMTEAVARQPMAPFIVAQ